nr:hypothetical protein Iba_chr14fCG1520 [Ipomoea batatas]
MNHPSSSIFTRWSGAQEGEIDAEDDVAWALCGVIQPNKRHFSFGFINGEYVVNSAGQELIPVGVEHRRGMFLEHNSEERIATKNQTEQIGNPISPVATTENDNSADQIIEEANDIPNDTDTNRDDSDGETCDDTVHDSQPHRIWTNHNQGGQQG